MKHIKQDSDRDRMERMKQRGHKDHIHMVTKSGSSTKSKSKSKSWLSRISYSPKISSNTHIPSTTNTNREDSVISLTRQRSRSKSTQSITSRASRRSSVHMKRYIVHQFLPIVFKLSLLSFWCAISTVILGFFLWTIYPSLSSCIDATINGLCVYLAFAFAKPVYKIICLPFYSCSKCTELHGILSDIEAENENGNDVEHTHAVHPTVQASIEML